jgi:Outer membrane protein beta-barrel domain
MLSGKIKLSVLCTLCLMAVPLQSHAGWGLGPLAGLNLANADVKGRDTHSITGWAFGGRVEMGMLLPFLGVMVDPMLVESGVDFDADGNAIPGRGRFVNLEVPLLLKARLGLAGLGVYAFLGPDLVFNTNASGHVVASDDLGNSDVQRTGLAGQVGGGIDFGLAPLVSLTADARYSHGFTNLLSGAKGDVKEWRNRDVRLTLGLLLHSP